MNKDFEVISNSDPEMESDSENELPDEIKIKTSTTMNSDNDYSQNDKTFMFELYRENKSLLDKIAEKDKRIAKLEERSVYLSNSNVFWLFCYIGSTAIGLFSLIHH